MTSTSLISILTANRIDHNPEFKLNGTENKFCSKADLPNTVNFPGDFSSDAQFFVFIGVITWLYCFARCGSVVRMAVIVTSLLQPRPVRVLLCTVH